MISNDYLPTVLDAVGHSDRVPDNVDGRSLRPLFSVDPANGYQNERPLFWHYPHYGNQGGSPGGAVRKGDWKLIQWYEDGRQELFNLADDLGEAKNLADAHPQQVAVLAELLDEWRSEGAR